MNLELSHINFLINCMMNNIPEISIVIPVYNAEEYICRCVDSLLEQSMPDFELLLIDDGSPDSSGMICDSYAEIDSRIKVYHKKNEGVSAARQFGLEKSVGKYIIYADSDDWADFDMLKTLYCKALEEDADVVICDFFTNENGIDTYIEQHLEKLDSDSILRNLLGQKLHGATWNKLIKREKLYKYNIKFPKNINRWEDLWINCHLFLFPMKVAYVTQAFYHYALDVNPQSLVHKVTKSGVDSQIQFCNHFFTLLEYEDYKDELYKCISVTKELMFSSRLYSVEEIINFYPIFNERYCEENKRYSYNKHLSWCVAKMLKGKIKCAYLIDNIYTNFIFPVGKVVKKIINIR